MSSAKFSEIPYFMLSEYFNKLFQNYKKKENINTSYTFDNISEVEFKDKELKWNGFLDWNGTNEQFFQSSFIKSGKLTRNNIGIKADGGNNTTLYVKKENYGYKKVSAIIDITKEKVINENYFSFILNFNPDIFPGIFENLFDLDYTIENTNKIKYLEKINSKQMSILTYIESNDDFLYPQIIDTYKTFNVIEPLDIFKSQENKTYAFKYYRKYLSKEQEVSKIEPEDEFYFRKDSYFLDWFRKNLKNNKEYSQKKYVNDNLLFIYFGQGFKQYDNNVKWEILHYSLKDFMINSMPENNLNSANKLFLWNLYDEIYEETYNTQRNIFTLIDPEDIDEDFLIYLSKFYKIDFTSYKFSTKMKREFIKNLPFLLSKKGTQTSLQIIWKSLIGNKNKVTFYERWHNKYKKSSLTKTNLKELKNDTEK